MRDVREAHARQRQDKAMRDYYGALAGRNHPLLTPDWRVTMEKRRIDAKLWQHNPNMVRGHA